MFAINEKLSFKRFYLRTLLLHCSIFFFVVYLFIDTYSAFQMVTHSDSLLIMFLLLRVLPFETIKSHSLGDSASFGNRFEKLGRISEINRIKKIIKIN